MPGLISTPLPRANSRGIRNLVVVLCGAALLAHVPEFISTSEINEGADPSQSRFHRVLVEKGQFDFTLDDERSLNENIATMKLSSGLLRGNNHQGRDHRALAVYAEVAAEVARLLEKKVASMQYRPNTQESIAIAEYDDETGVATFPACEGLPLEVCERIIQKGLKELGLPFEQFKLEERKKRDKDAEGYNKVVIVTDLLADSVAKDPTYPYKWNGTEGNRDIGPWSCVGLAPDECCSVIKQDVQDADASNIDEDGNPYYIECEITVPVGGQGNSDLNRIIVNESPDGRVHEIPTTG